MAAPIAYEQPTLNKAWDAFVAHIPTYLVIWIVSAVIWWFGYGVKRLLMMVGNGGSLEGLGSAMDSATTYHTLTLGFWLGHLGEFPFWLLSNFVGVLCAAVPALYYATGEKITVDDAFRTLFHRPWRYLLAGIFLAIAAFIGFCFCILPGIAVLLVTPIYVNKIFTTEMSIFDAFSSSFQAVYRSDNGWTFVGIQILAGVVVFALCFCTCFFGLFFAPAIAGFYIQNAAYRQGVLT